MADTWTPEATAPYDIGDTGSATLADGRILDSTRSNNKIQIYDPVANKWTAAGTSPLSTGDENSWASLQNGGVLAVGYHTDGAAIYNPATGMWARTGPVPSGFDTGDTGGISQMFDGRVFVYGLAGASYIYTPGATAADPGTWASGSQDAQRRRSGGRILGHAAQRRGVGRPRHDDVRPGRRPAAVRPDHEHGLHGDAATGHRQSVPIGYVNLPNGQVMVTAATQNWIYTPATAPQDAWRPTVTSVVANADGSYTLTGTQLSGLINGADEGDDMTMAENYPIVWLTNEAGDVYYCRSFAFSNMMPSKGPAPETCQFTTPKNLPEGTYNLYVSAVGVSSKTAVTFTPGVGGTVSTDAGTSSGDAAESGDDSSTDSDGAATTAGDADSSGGASGDGGAAGTERGHGAADGTAPTRERALERLRMPHGRRLVATRCRRSCSLLGGLALAGRRRRRADRA